LVKFAFQAAETEKALTQLQKVSGTSFENLSSLQQVFAAGGTPLKKFADEFGNLSEQVREAGQQAKIRDASKDTVEWANNVSQVKRQFDNLAQGVTQTFSPLTTLETKVQAVKEALAKGPTSMVPGVSDVVSAEQQWSKLADIFKNLASDMDRAQLGKALGLSPESIATLSKGSAAIQQLQAGTVALNSTLSATDQISLQQLTSQWNQLSTAASAFFQSLGAAAAPVISAMLADFTNALNTMQAALNNFSFQSFINGAIAAGNALKYLTIPGLVSKGIQAAGDAAGFAGGGLLGGGGTGTSDSNLAWVSRGEHIMPARTVAQPGVLAFLEALRRSGGNLSAVLNGMGRFALGGMVPRAMPAFASGGLAGGMNHVTIAFPGLPPIGGLRATSAVVDELHKAAALAQVRSGGRKPSRYA
jgi:hypothetical protein